jgi:4-hydroxy 2-oxovalerate aldolase
MAHADCQCIYVVDLARALCLRAWPTGLAPLVAERGDAAQVGLHGHETLGLGSPTSSRRGHAPRRSTDRAAVRPGAGNAPVEARIGVFDSLSQ